MNLKQIKANLTALDLGSKIVFFSYNTPVALYNKDTWECFKTDKFWSNTTTKHINSIFDVRMKVQEKPQEYFDSLIKEVA